MLYNLHLLRVIAALGVVYFHTTSDAGLRLDWDVGSRGVDVFFVISGFIIAYIGTGKPEQFFRRRMIRVVPFYWAATLVVFAAARVAPALFRTTSGEISHLLHSLVFIPHAHQGEMHPTLILGWSLNFEIFFYVLFGLALRISQRWSPVITVGWIVLFVIAIHTIAGNNDITNFYARPIVLEFCYGIGVYYAFVWCSARRDQLAAGPALKWLLLVVALSSLLAIITGEQYLRDSIPRYLLAGVPSFFLVLSALLLEKIYGVATNNKLIYLIGESSYIIYLIHPYIVFSVLRVGFKGASAWSSPALAALILGLLALTSVVSIAIHLWFEKPVMAYLRKRLT